MSIEPEEVIEAKLVSLLAAALSMPVAGVLSPAPAGEVRSQMTESFCRVKVDQASQDGDYRTAVPHTYSAEVSVEYALADDASGVSFRDCCRAVRSVLTGLTGDGCTALDAIGFGCSSCRLDATDTNFADGESPTLRKIYSLTITGITG